MTFHSNRRLVHLSSSHSVSETFARLERVVAAKRIQILARIDHSGDAARVGLKMNQTELLMFRNAKAWTPLMVAPPTLAIDLPVKAPAWHDGDGKVWLSYNSPEYLAERHSVPQELLANIAAIKFFCRGCET